MKLAWARQRKDNASGRHRSEFRVVTRQCGSGERNVRTDVRVRRAWRRGKPGSRAEADTGLLGRTYLYLVEVQERANKRSVRN